jgi:large subunit ribosomal protein L28
MAKVCEICGKGPSTGNSVSHSVRRTKRRFLPNLVKKKILDPLTNLLVRKKICTSCLRTMNKKMAETNT